MYVYTNNYKQRATDFYIALAGKNENQHHQHSITQSGLNIMHLKKALQYVCRYVGMRCLCNSQLLCLYITYTYIRTYVVQLTPTKYVKIIFILLFFFFFNYVFITEFMYLLLVCMYICVSIFVCDDVRCKLYVRIFSRLNE